jgi:hypothetical protein
MKFGEPIDLEALKRSANGEGESTVVSRAWLKRALAELTAGRAAQERLGHCFGLPQDKAL